MNQKKIGIALMIVGVVLMCVAGLAKGLVVSAIGFVLLDTKILDKIAQR